MRPIKFRCYVKKTGVMVYRVEQMYDGLGTMRCVNKTGKESWRDPHSCLIDFCTSFGAFLGYYDAEDGSEHPPPDTIELMQFTGLKDKNGKEIYEGDLLMDCLTKMKYVVKFGYCKRYGFVGWYVENEEMGYVGSLGGDYDTNKNSQIEIIGNIYENPCTP